MSIADEITDGLNDLMSGNETVIQIGATNYAGLKNFGSNESLEMLAQANKFTKVEQIRLHKGAVGDTDTVTVGATNCYASLRGVVPEPRDLNVTMNGLIWRVMIVDNQESVVVLTLGNKK